MASLRRLVPARLMLLLLCCSSAVALAFVGGADAKKRDSRPGLAAKGFGAGKAKGNGRAGKGPKTAAGGHGKSDEGGRGRGAKQGAGDDAGPPGRGGGGKGGAPKAPKDRDRDRDEGKADAAGSGKSRHRGGREPAPPPAPAPPPPAPSGAGEGPAGAAPGRGSARRLARRRAGERGREGIEGVGALDAAGRRLFGALAATDGPLTPRGGGSASERGREEALGGSVPGDGRDGAGPGEPLFRLLGPSAAGRLAEVVPPPVQWLAAALGALLSFLAFGTLLGWWRARRLERQRERLLEEVGLLQAALLPAVPERLGGLRASVAYRPWEGPGAGGDFYDAFPLGPDRVGLVIGDVSGHGREVLSRTAALRHTLRAYLEAGLEPCAALAVGGRVLDRNFDAGFATVALAVHDAAAGTLTYATAGHPPPILLGPPAHDPVTVCASPPIGAGLATGLRQTTVAMAPGAAACFFTDGVVEARTGDGMLGRERLAALLEQLGSGATAKDLLHRVAGRADGVGDDMAICVLRAEEVGAPAPTAAAPLRIEELALAGEDVDSSAIQRFLWACGAPGGEGGPAIAAARAVVAESGGAVLRVELAPRRARVEVLPPDEAPALGLGRSAPPAAVVDG